MTVPIISQRHREITEKQLNDIAFLKDQLWPHGLDSQKAWIAKNFDADDVHLILYQEDAPVAYASLNSIQCTIDSQIETLWGLGGVCVAKSCQRQGLGKLIVEGANRFLTASQLPGLLLCHKELTGFYNLCGWEILHCKKVTVEKTPFKHFVMSFGKQYGNINSLAIPKNF